MRAVGLAGAAARAGGLVFEAASHVASALRTAPKPLHPRGTVWLGRITRTGGGGVAPTGVPWLDEAGTDEAIVRVSAAIGLPHGWPDIQGVAVRLPDQDGADLLFASTGAGPVSRFVLRLVRPTTRHVASTLLPYRGPRGSVVLAAAFMAPGRYTLLRAQGGAPWVGFGRMELLEELYEEPSYDPVLRPLPGLANHPWVERLRAPAYRAARHDRGADRAASPD